MKREKHKKVSRSLFSLWQYLLFFLLVSFVISCSFLLFFSLMDVSWDYATVQRSAKLTFLNVVFLSFVFTLIDGIRRKLTVERPVMRILGATHALTQGDFSVRIQPFHGFDSTNEIDAIIEDFNKMAEELSGIETLRTDFIASVSHELKTPLAVIQNYATMLQTPNLPEEKRLEYAKTVTDASRRLSGLITNILKLNKLENQKIFSEAKEFDLSEQLCECLLGFEDAWEKKGMELETAIADGVKIMADEALLSLVWNNLFSNAVKFTGQSGKITVSLEEESDFAVVRVSDTGCGMSAETGAHIFEKFYQGDSSHATQGNGLGLSLVKRVVDILGGEILVNSTLGKGSAFTVKLRRVFK